MSQRRGGALTAVFLRFGKATSSSAIQAVLDLFRSFDNQRSAQRVIAGRQLAIRGAAVHICQLFLHRLCGEHGYILEAEGLEYMLVQVIVQGLTGNTLEAYTCPIDADLVGVRNSDSASGTDCLHRTPSPHPAGLPEAAVCHRCDRKTRHSRLACCNLGVSY